MAQQPYLDEKSVRDVLDALRQAAPLESCALADFLIVREPTHAPEAVAGAAARAQVIYALLVDRITGTLDRLRALEGISPAAAPPNRTAAEAALCVDFSRGNAELEAWSVLYHRYVRVDLDLQMQSIAALVSQYNRTIRRRLSHGVARLTEQLIAEERAARARQAQRRMRLALPVAAPLPLFDMDEAFEAARAALEDRRAVALHGAGGLGKTALAINLAHALIDAEAIDDLVWLSAPAFETLPARLLEGLGMAAADAPDPVIALRAYAQTYRLLVVLDAAEALMADAAALADLLAALSGACVLVASRVAPPADAPIQLVTLRELDRPAAWALMEQEFARVDSRPIDTPYRDAQFAQIWDAVGGNPLALRVVVGHLRFFGVDRIVRRLGALPVRGAGLFDALYRAAWDTLDEPARRLWLALLVFPSAAANDLEALPLAGVFEAALAALASRALVDVHAGPDGEPRYALARLVRAFLVNRLDDTPARDFVAGCARALAGRLVARADAHDDELVFARGVHLLAEAARFGLSADMALRLAAAVHDCAAGLGRWAEWASALQALHGLRDIAAVPGARLLVWQGEAARHLGQLEPAAALLLEAIHAATGADQAAALMELAAVYRLGGRPGAEQTAVQARRTFAALGDAEGEARAVAELAQIWLDVGRAADALRLLDGTPAPDALRARWEALRGNAYLRQERYDAALVSHRRAVALAGQDAHRLNRARALVNLGRAQLAVGALDDAEASFTQALDQMAQVHDVLGRVRARANLAVLYAERGRHRRALDLLGAVLDEQEAFGDRHGAAVSRQNLAELRLMAADAALRRGQVQAAVQHLEAGRAFYDALGMEARAEAAGRMIAELRAAS